MTVFHSGASSRPTIRRRYLLAMAIVAGVALPALAREPAPLARTHMVASANPMASDAGLAVLRAGGSAVDAAIAVQLVLSVVEPQASGIGGGGFLMYYAARSRQVTAWDGRETAPAGATPIMFLAGDKPMSFPLAVVSGLSVGVPGSMRMLEAVHRRHGKLAWRDLFTPAIKLAEDGFPVPPRLARALATEPALRNDPQARGLYFNDDGAPRREGEVMRNPALAATLRLLADSGADALHRGALADAIVAAVQREPRPGSMTAEDLADYRPLERTPLCRAVAAGTDRTGTTICGMGPPTSGTIAVLQILALVPRYDDAPPGGDDCQDARAPLPGHALAEAGRLAFADRDRWVADPAFVPVPVDGLLDDGYLDGRRAGIAACRSLGKAPAGQPPGTPALPPVAAPVKPEAGTTHMAIVDREGNVVSFTTTIESSFGARRMVGGFLLNNELTDFSLRPAVDGRPVANRVQPGKRPRSSMTPLIALDRDGRFLFAIGSAGGPRIIGDVAQATLRLLHDPSQTMQAAIAGPRLLNLNGVTEVEAGPTAEATAASLRARGHEVRIVSHHGGLHGIRARYDGAGKLMGYEGGADPRRDGVAVGD
ncbi:gamma-glutamyltransferase family protein [Vineibacter terrae]|uniref:gamma-glutamyltransferase family protein n=1 Tax=Vineibacter terrae TaxID=2586908 RepID=UPI002E30C9CD|nr:gamma-glutamyltransferase family protein [Vineibacter terrae]HEX2892173.1 gamma-glutamyltransferase family protein [Vineibacter terrae]